MGVEMHNHHATKVAVTQDVIDSCRNEIPHPKPSRGATSLRDKQTAALLYGVRRRAPYKADSRERRPFNKDAAIMADAGRLLVRRHGRVFRENEWAIIDLAFMARVFDEIHFRHLIDGRAPWFAPRVDAAIAQAAKLGRPTPIKISRHFQLTWKERCEYGIGNLPAADVLGDELRDLKKKRRHERNRLRMRRLRRKEGRLSREKYLAENAISASKP
jgi:hypothetical protein